MIAALPYVVFVPAVGDETTLVLPGGKPALLGVPFTVNIGGVGVGVPPGVAFRGTTPAALVLVGLMIVVGVALGVGCSVGVLVGAIVGVGIGVSVGVGMIGVSVGVGMIGVSVGVGRTTVGVGKTTVGVGRIIVTVGSGIGVLLRRAIILPVGLCIPLFAYAFGDTEKSSPTNTNSIRMQKSAIPLCNADSRCLASFRART